MADSHCLAWVVWDEARGEPVESRRAVLDAVRERMKQKGKTACEVIAEPRQFSGYKLSYVQQVDENMLTMYEEADRIKPQVRGCAYFHATYVSPSWASKLTKCATINKHVFYKESKK